MNIERAEEILRQEFVEDCHWLSPGLIQSLVFYAHALSEWSHRVDLVAPASSEVIFNRHIVDSICAWFHLREIIKNLDSESAVIDVGSGAGLPGLVFALLEPGREIQLCEPREKRQIFLQHIKSKLDLKNVCLLQCRLEELRKFQKTKASLAICRALGMELDYLRGCGDLAIGKVAQMLGPNQPRPVDIVPLEKGTLRQSVEIAYDVRVLGAKRLLRVWECFT